MSPKTIAVYFVLVLLGVGLFLGLILPYDKETYHQKAKERRKAAYEAAYVDHDEWAEGRPCTEVAFRCLPESRDRRWQEQNLSDGLDTFALTQEVMQKQKEIVQRWRDEEAGKAKEEDMQVAAISEAFYDRVEAKRFLIEMEQQLAEEFPGFWRETPKPVRYRWIRRAMNKAKRFGIKSKGPGAMIELCARIGLDFDKDPKWKQITRFVAKDPKNNIGVAINYIDWTVFEKTHARTGTPITDWLMGRAIGELPPPKKPYPRINQHREVYY